MKLAEKPAPWCYTTGTLALLHWNHGANEVEDSPEPILEAPTNFHRRTRPLSKPAVLLELAPGWVDGFDAAGRLEAPQVLSDCRPAEPGHLHQVSS